MGRSREPGSSDALRHSRLVGNTDSFALSTDLVCAYFDASFGDKLSLVTRALTQILDVVLPTSCIFCESLGSHQCAACEQRYQPTPQWVERQNLVGLCATDLTSGASILLRAAKDQGRTALIARMAHDVSHALDLAAANEEQERLLDALRQRDTHLVPIPISAEASLIRGFDVVSSLTRKMSGQLGLQTHRGLRLVRQPKDQRRLGVQDRFSNLQEAMGYRSVDSISRTVVLVDDVVTTGATLLEAARAVNATGDIVAGFITFAQTRRVLDAKNLK